MLQESSGLQAAKGLVAMAAGQGTSEKANQQIIIIAPPGGGSDQKHYLLTSGRQLVQRVCSAATGGATFATKLDGYRKHFPTAHIYWDQWQIMENSLAAQGVKIVPSAVKTDNSENYQLIFVQTSQEPRSNVETIARDQQNAVSRELTPTVPSTDRQVVVSSSHGNHTDIQATSMGEQVVSPTTSRKAICCHGNWSANRSVPDWRHC